MPNRVFDFGRSFPVDDGVAIAVAWDPFGVSQVALVIRPKDAGLHTYRRGAGTFHHWRRTAEYYRPWVQRRLASALTEIVEGVKRAAPLLDSLS